MGWDLIPADGLSILQMKLSCSDTSQVWL